MSDPLSFVPLALAAADGSIDAIPCRRLVAAGVALLQRTAPLVRALDGREAAIILPIGPELLVALAACAGRAALLLEPGDDSAAGLTALRSREVGAVFTVRELADSLPPEVPRVLLDDAPTRAEWQASDGSRAIDLSLRGGLLLEGDPETAGSEEIAVRTGGAVAAGAATSPALTHRVLLASARACARAQRMDHRTRVLAVASPASAEALVAGLLAPLLAGGEVSGGDPYTPESLCERLERDAITSLVARPETYAAIASTLEAQRRHLDAPLLQHCIAVAPFDGALAARWRAVSAVPLARPALEPPTSTSPHRGTDGA